MPHKKKQSDGLSAEAAAELGIDRKTVAQIVASMTGAVKTAAELEPPIREIVQPDPNTARPRPSGSKNRQEYPSFAEKAASQPKKRLVGPRKRAPGEPGTIYTGENVLVKMGVDYLTFDIKRPLVRESRDGVEMYLSIAQQNELVAAGFDDLSAKGDASEWMAPKTKQAMAVVQQLATKFDGKDARIGR
jgi:hypothetical protein